MTANLQIHTKKEALGGKDVVDHPMAWKGGVASARRGGASPRSKVGTAVVPSHPAGLSQSVHRPPLPVLFLPASAAATKHADPSGHAACFARRDLHRWLAKEALAEESQVAHSAV